MDAIQYDILIVGAGAVGSTLACALRGRGLRVALVAPVRAARDDAAEGAADPGAVRPIALSHASRAYLLSLGIPVARLGTPIRTIHVSQQGGFGRTEIQAAEHGIDALGYVYESPALEAVIAPIAADPAIKRLDAQVLDWIASPEGVEVRLRGAPRENPICTRLLVVADGGALAAATHERGPTHAAVVGTVSTDKPHNHTAFERFTPNGPLALLPLGNRYAFVWALPIGVAHERLIEDANQFCRSIHTTFGDRLGRFGQVGTRYCFPLVQRRAATIPAGAVIAVGNAAQTLHPVAGQGLNLGLRDVGELVALIDEVPVETISNTSFARRFNHARWLDRESTITTTRLLATVFANDQTVMSALRGSTLGFLDVFSPSRRFFARRMMLGARG